MSLFLMVCEVMAVTWRNWNSHMLLGNVKWSTCFGKQQFGSFFKKEVLSYDLAILTPDLYPRERKGICSQEYLFINVHIETFLITWKLQTAHMSIHKWMNEQMWYIHTADYSPEIKGMMLHANVCNIDGIVKQLCCMKARWMADCILLDDIDIKLPENAC